MNIRAVLSKYSAAIVCAGFFCLAFGLRYHFLVTYDYPLMIHEQDAVAYTNFAKEFLRLKLTDTSLPPLYPILIALFSFLPVSLEFGARLASITMDSLVVVPLFYLARRYTNTTAALATVLLWCFCSFSLYFTVSPLTQSTYLCMLMSTIALLYRGLEEKSGGMLLVAAGFFSGLCYLARIEGILSFVAGLFLCAIWLLREKRKGAAALLTMFRFTAGFFLAAGPYLVYLHSRVGYWTVSVRGEQELKTPDAVNTLDAAGKLAKSTARGIGLWTKSFGSLSDLAAFAGSNAKGFFQVYLHVFPPWFHLIALAGLILLVFRCRFRSLYLLLLPAMTAPIYVLNLPKTPSYFYPVFPFVLLCFVAAAAAAALLAEEMAGRVFTSPASARFTRYIHLVIFLPVLYLSGQFFATADGTFRDPGLIEQAKLTQEIYRDAGNYLRYNSLPGEAVVTRWGLISYFAERPLIILPKGGVEQVIEFSRKNGGKYLVIDSISVYSRRQELEELLGPLLGKNVSGKYRLQPVYVHVAPTLGAGYVIYRIL